MLESEIQKAILSWLASQGIWHRRLSLGAVKIKGGEELTDEEQAKVRSIVARYGKQLAAFAREAAMDANPELRKIAEIFSAG